MSTPAHPSSAPSWRTNAFFLTTIALGLLTVRCTTSTSATGADSGTCSQPDQDGVVGGSYTFEVNVTDTAFSPVILKAQNAGQVTLTVRNVGTKAHDFVVQCLTVQGCVACFPDAAKVGPLDAGTSATVTFTAPDQEGIYSITSDVPGDSSLAAQFVLQ